MPFSQVAFTSTVCLDDKNPMDLIRRRIIECGMIYHLIMMLFGDPTLGGENCHVNLPSDGRVSVRNCARCDQLAPRLPAFRKLDAT
jgi:hypothetical protein